MRRLTVQEEDQIIDLYIKQEKSTTEVAEVVGYSSTLVAKVVKRRGYQVRSISKAKKGKSVSKRKEYSEEEIINLYKSGKSANQIGRKMNLSQSTILKVIRKSDVEMRNFSDYEYGDVETHQKMKKLYLSGKSLMEVADELNVSYTNTHRVLSEFGVIRTELEYKSNVGKTISEKVKEKIKITKQIRKERGDYDHIYLERTGYTYEEFKKIQPKFRKYRQEVRSVTNSQSLHELDNYDKRGVSGQDGAYHLDHIYSVADGFQNNVPAEIVGNISNLKMIPWEMNLLKNSNSWITLNELKKRVSS